MTVVLMLPAIVVTVCFFLILFGIERDPGTPGGKFDVDRLLPDHRRASAS